MARKAADSSALRAKIGILTDDASMPEEVGLRTAWKPIYCANYDTDEEGNRQYHHFQNRRCSCKPGPHWIALTAGATVDELALVGGRGSGKSEHGFPLLIGPDVGDVTKPVIHNKHYRALVLRRNAKDLHNWFARAREFFGMFGAVPAESPTMKFKFPSGAEIICDHLEDENAYQKYLGHEYARILIEECPQIPDEGSYLNIRRSNRVRHGLGLRPRMIVLGNPDGPGLGWFIKRFVKLDVPCKVNGQPGLRPLRSGERWTNPKSGETRMFIHSTVYDNPYFLIGDGAYVKQLEGIEDDTERRRWLMGDFTAMVGQYFPTFRPNGPMPGEPENARHVFPADSLKIEPWWPRIMGMDIGYRHHSAVYKAALAPDGRLIVYDELVEAEVDNEEWGMRVALWCQKELPHLPSRSIPLFLSHEAFGNRGEGRTQAEQLAHGIRKVLGSTGVMLTGSHDSETSDLNVSEEDQFFRLIAERQGPRVIIRRPFSRKRVDGWSFIRILMKWTGAGAVDAKRMNPDHIRRLAESGDQDAVNEYLRSFEVNHGEVLPRLAISDKCQLLIGAIPTLVYDSGGKNPEDVRKTETIEDDIADAFRYLCTSYRRISEKIPRSVHFAQVREQAMKSGVPDEFMFHHMVIAAAEYEQQQAENGPFRYGMGSSRMRGFKKLQ